jgi:hypothetical protein
VSCSARPSRPGVTYHKMERRKKNLALDYTIRGSPLMRNQSRCGVTEVPHRESPRAQKKWMVKEIQSPLRSIARAYTRLGNLTTVLRHVGLQWHGVLQTCGFSTFPSRLEEQGCLRTSFSVAKMQRLALAAHPNASQ